MWVKMESVYPEWRTLDMVPNEVEDPEAYFLYKETISEMKSLIKWMRHERCSCWTG